MKGKYKIGKVKFEEFKTNLYVHFLIISESFNVNTIANTFLLQKKNKQIKLLKDQLELL